MAKPSAGPGATRSLDDPYADKDAVRRQRLVWALVIVLAATASYIRWDHNQRGHYFWQNPPAAVPSAETVTVEAAPAAEAPSPK